MPHTILKGLQTITWGDSQTKHFPRIFEHARQAGYEGVEIGFGRMEKTPPKTLAKELDNAGLTLVATHMGGNIEGPAQAQQVKAQVDTILQVAAELEIPFLHYSGIQYTGDDNLAYAIDYLNTLARRVRETGTRLLYHNHAFEFDHDGKVMEALLRHTDSALGFCVDIGWLHKGRVEIIPFLESIRERIGTLHYKDFASVDARLDTVPLGTGVVPLEAVSHWARSHLRDGFWVLAEQDKPVHSAEEEVAANGAYLSRAFADS